MENKIQTHGVRKIFFDLLRDTNSTKYSLTLVASLIGLLLLSATVIISLIIMVKAKTIDHTLIVELIGFVLTLLGYKNGFGFKKNPQTPITNTKIDPYVKEEKLPREKIDDTTNDSIKH